MKNSKFISCSAILSGIFALMLTIPGFAQDKVSTNSYKNMQKEANEQFFQELDKNKDGRISELEVDLAADDRFHAIDLDGDGYLSDQELYLAVLKQEETYNVGLLQLEHNPTN
ncbi:EF-hand domain-containing protein [Candidatus Nitrosacidococcus sp. I8]|uniref:EF-hand domain-containing protein n=1 Tax=Candidatus Nitrosacidococcus sp. I8 TaxID=2942908 RepID=UPI0022279000|nr:EF-hand domain-containing protein [Candidatus Nitrosacidococcus sp. I8]CAH9014257.1 hypothetical protein NURINAE_00039 [Candidatus Nitrosacidococcus sp. I8]